MNYGAFGLVEVVGSSNAILVIDQMLKTSDVSFFLPGRRSVVVMPLFF